MKVVSLASRPETPRDALVRELEAAQIELEFLNCNRSFQFTSAVWRLRGIIARFSPDCVLSFLFHANVICALASLGNKCLQFQSLRVIEQGTWRRRVQGWSASWADQLFCVSRGVRDFATRSLRISERKLTVIPNGVDLVDFDGEPEIPWPADNRSHRLIAVGRLAPQKGFAWLIDLAASLLHRQPDWQLVIIGDGPQRRELEERIAALDLTKQVHLVGWQPDVRRWLAAADLFVLSSRWEGMPNALLEAMAAGLPVCATPVEGVAELLPGPLAQQVIARNDDQSAVDLLEKLMSESPLRKRLGAANRAHVAKHFSIDQMVDRYALEITHLCQRQPS